MKKRKIVKEMCWLKAFGIITIIGIIFVVGMITLDYMEETMKNHSIELSCGHEKETCKKYLCIADFYGSTTTGNTYLQKYIIECRGEYCGQS